MIRIRYVFYIVLLIFALRSCTGCCEDPPEVPFDFTSIETLVPENAFAEEIHLKITLSDTTDHFLGSALFVPDFGFTNAYGLSCNDLFFVPNQKVKGIMIETLYDISPLLPAGTDVSDNFYARDFLYYSLDELISKLSQIEVYFSPESVFSVFLKEKVENSMARFRIEIEFTDGRSMTDTTAIIHIINK